MEPPTVEGPHLAGLSLFRGEVCAGPASADDPVTPCRPRQRRAVVGSPRAQVRDKMRRSEERIDPAVGGRHLLFPYPGHLPAAVPQRLDPDVPSPDAGDVGMKVLDDIPCRRMYPLQQ